MAYELSSAVLFFLVKELKKIEGGKVEKIYQLDKNIFVFKIHTSSGKFNLKIDVPSSVNLSKQTFSAPMNPPGFCMFLRKYLGGARIVSVEQKSFERILIIKFSYKDNVFKLIVELFKPGNIILCEEKEEGLVVINALHRQKFKDRDVWTKKPYFFPPELSNILLVSSEELVSIIGDSDRELVKVLAQKFGLGGEVAEAIISLSSLDKSLLSLSVEDASKLLSSAKKFFSEDKLVVVKSGKLALVSNSGEESISESFENLGSNSSSASSSASSGVPISEVIDSLNVLPEIDLTTVSSKVKKKTESLVSIQEKMISKLEKEIVENQEKGEYVYERYQEFKDLIDKANKISKEKGFDVLESVLKQNKKFKSINRASKELVFDF